MTAAVSGSPVVHDDPLAAALAAFEVLPWCVDALLAKVDREVLTRQLAFHAHRLETGFPFTGHPARYLFRACLNDYQPPAEFHAARQRPATEEAPRSTAPRRARAQTAVLPVETPQTVLTREGALAIIRLGLKSRLPGLKAEAERLAREWQVDTRALAG